MRKDNLGEHLRTEPYFRGDDLNVSSDSRNNICDYTVFRKDFKPFVADTKLRNIVVILVIFKTLD